jgi:hypothetical protein
MTTGATGAPLPLVPDDHQAFLGQKYPIVVAQATFEGSPGSYSATIDWGDGTALDTLANVVVFPTFLFVADDHDYATAGSYTAHVTIKDGNGAVSTVDDTIQVVPPPISHLQGNDISATAGVPFGPITLASFAADHVFGLPGDHFRAEIDWGDGTIPEDGTQGTVIARSSDPSAGTLYDVQGSHTYAKPGTYTIHITLDGVQLPGFSIQANVRSDPPGGSTSNDSGRTIAGASASQSGPGLTGPIVPSAMGQVFAAPTRSAVSAHHAVGNAPRIARHLPRQTSEGDVARRPALSPRTHLHPRLGLSRVISAPLSLKHPSVT